MFLVTLTPAARARLSELALKQGKSLEEFFAQSLNIVFSALGAGDEPVKVEEIVGGQYVAEGEFNPKEQIKLGG